MRSAIGWGPLLKPLPASQASMFQSCNCNFQTPFDLLRALTGLFTRNLLEFPGAKDLSTYPATIFGLEMADLAISSKVSLTLDLPPSCVQFCPAHPEYFVIGTYNLQKEEGTEDHQDASRGDTAVKEEGDEPKKTQSRNGSLVVYRCHGSTL